MRYDGVPVTPACGIVPSSSVSRHLFISLSSLTQANRAGAHCREAGLYVRKFTLCAMRIDIEDMLWGLRMGVGTPVAPEAHFPHTATCTHCPKRSQS